MCRMLRYRAFSNCNCRSFVECFIFPHNALTTFIVVKQPYPSTNNATPENVRLENAFSIMMSLVQGLDVSKNSGGIEAKHLSFRTSNIWPEAKDFKTCPDWAKDPASRNTYDVKPVRYLINFCERQTFQSLHKLFHLLVSDFPRVGSYSLKIINLIKCKSQ